VACTVQLAPGAKLVPVQPSVPLVHDHIRPASLTTTLVTATLEPPGAVVLVNVTVPVPVRVPDGSVMVSGLGEMETVPLAATPVPVIVTGDQVTTAPGLV
jgi:hypothetical protein